MIQTQRRIQTQQSRLLSTLLLRVDFRTVARYRFHLILAAIFLVILVFGSVGMYLTHIKASGTGSLLLGLGVLFSAISPLPLYWHQRGEIDKRDATFVIYWTMLFAFFIRYPVLVAARLRFPLRDSLFARIDQSLLVCVPVMMRWISGHPWLRETLNYSYNSLVFMFFLAVLLPALFGRNGENAQRFVVANALGFLISLPIFVLLPAIGPWVGYHFEAIEPQQTCGATISALRSAGDYFYNSGDVGIICFPSFHVIWAILAVYGLWGFRKLRVPATLLSALIVISTMSTGWHYFVDVLGGAVVAFISIALAKLLLPKSLLPAKRFTSKAVLRRSVSDLNDSAAILTPFGMAR